MSLCYWLVDLFVFVLLHTFYLLIFLRVESEFHLLITVQIWEPIKSDKRAAGNGWTVTTGSFVRQHKHLSKFYTTSRPVLNSSQGGDGLYRAIYLSLAVSVLISESFSAVFINCLFHCPLSMPFLPHMSTSAKHCWLPSFLHLHFSTSVSASSLHHWPILPFLPPCHSPPPIFSLALF